MTLSIIIPCFNVMDYIDNCLHSVFAQTFKGIEVICVDNNSTDETFNILKRYESKGKILLLKEEKEGASAARNLGLKHAKGSWIQFLDADDILMPNKILNQINYLDHKLSFIVGNYYYLIGDTKKEVVFNNNMNVFVLLSTNCIGNTCSNLFNKKYLDKIGGWDESLKSSQEVDLMHRLLLENEKIIFSDGIDTIIIRIDNSISTSNKNQYLNLIRRLLLRIRIYSNRADYKLSRKDDYSINDSLYTTIRELYFFQPKKAIALNKVYFPNGFNLKPSKANSIYYVISYKLFGFSFANLISKIPKHLRRYVRN